MLDCAQSMPARSLETPCICLRPCLNTTCHREYKRSHCLWLVGGFIIYRLLYILTLFLDAPKGGSGDGDAVVVKTEPEETTTGDAPR